MPVPNPPYLSVFRSGKSMPFEWKVITEPDEMKGSILVAGTIAQRMIELLKAYGKASANGYIDPRDRSPNCHSAALYIAGLIPNPYRISAEKIKEAYQGLDELISQEIPESLPAIVHLLKKETSIRRLGEMNCEHTAIAVGYEDREIVCFQKHNYGPANFALLKSAEKKYSTTKRLWANVC